jgi:hypothetical protein
LEDGGFDFGVDGLDFLFQLFGWGFVVGVVDGDVGAFGGEFAGDFCAQTSIL